MHSSKDARKRVGYAVLMVAALLIVALSANVLSSGVAPTTTAGKGGGPQLDKPLGAALSSGAAQAPVKANPNAQQIGQVTVVRATHADTSIALRDMTPAAALPRTKEGPENPLPFFKPVGPVKDPVVQKFFGLDAMPTPIASWPGIQFSQGGTGWPPDTNGDVPLEKPPGFDCLAKWKDHSVMLTSPGPVERNRNPR